MRFYEPTKQDVDRICRTFDARTTLEFSKLEIWQHAGDGRAMAYLAHFLGGTGESVGFPFGRLLRDAPGVLNKVTGDFQHGIRAAWRRGDRHDTVLVEQRDYGLGTQAQRDWCYALGKVRIAWRTKSALSNQPTRHSERTTRTGLIGFHLTVIDEYLWHPENMVGKRTECIHKAGKLLAAAGRARNFKMMGECDIEFDPAGPIAIDAGPVRIWDIL